MEQSFPIESFRYGLDTRRDVLTSQPGTLVTASNLFVNQGGELEKRRAFTEFVDLDISDSNAHSGIAGIESTEDGIVAYTHARELEEAYVNTTGTASVDTNGSGSGATFDITAVNGAITAAVVNAGGSGYAVGDRLTLTTAVGTGAILTVATLAVTAVATVTITNNGNPQGFPFLVSTIPTGITAQRLTHPSLANDSSETYNSSLHRLDVFSLPPNQLLFSNSFNGKAFVSATFVDGNTFLYYDGALVQDSANGLVLSGRIALADLANDLALEITGMGWNALANRQVVNLTSITRSTTTATATYAAHGLSNGDFVEIFGAPETQYNGRFRIFNKTNDTFDYTMSSDPGGSATGTPQATVYQAGSVIIKSPPQDYWGATPEETSTAGQLGILSLSRDGAGAIGQPSVAQFRITVPTGTFTLTAPEDQDGSGLVDLGGGAVAARATAAETAIAIAAAVNDLTFVHGYFASVITADVFIYANSDWGDVTQNGNLAFNLNVTTTMGTVAVVGTAPPLQFSVSPVDIVYQVFVPGNSPVVVGVATSNGGPAYIINYAVSGGTPGYTFSIIPTRPGGNVILDGLGNRVEVTPRAASGQLIFTIPGSFHAPIDITASFDFKVTDSAGLSETKVVTVRIFTTFF